MSRLPSRLLLQPMLAYSIAREWLRVGSRRPENVSRILVAHHLLLGDTLMLAPLLAKLRQNYPAAEIVMTCPRAIVDLFAAKPYGVIALPYDPADASTLLNLWQYRGFDLAILPADNRLSWLARALGGCHIVGFSGDRPAYKSWFVDEKRSYPSTPTALPEIFASLVGGPEPPPFDPSHWPIVAASTFDLPSTPYAVLHLGASSPLKLWPSERWQALAQWLVEQGITPVWSAGKKETALVIAADPQSRHISYAGKLDLLQMARLLRNARLLVCPDTGIAHLGRIMNTPTITLFGPGSELLCGADTFWQNSPYRGLTVEIECRNQDILFKRQIDWVRRCARPLGDDMPIRCPKALCMEGITLTRVINACNDFIRKYSESTL